jgi:hypothetical protein
MRRYGVGGNQLLHNDHIKLRGNYSAGLKFEVDKHTENMKILRMGIHPLAEPECDCAKHLCHYVTT